MADVIVIGGGPGGYVCAIKLAMNGKKVVLVEKDKIGGTCLNRGCIPTKALMHCTEVLETVKEAEKTGIIVDSYRVDTDRINSYKDDVVRRLVGGVTSLMGANGIEVIYGQARFASNNTVKVKLNDGGTQEITAEKIVIASGSESAVIPIPGIDGKDVITSTEALDLSSVPKRLAVIGGGVIGIELGSVYAALGTEVTIVEALPGILPVVDEELAETVRKKLEKSMKIMTGAKVLSIEDASGAKKLSYEISGSRKELMADKVLVCVGRRPVTNKLALELTDIELTERGLIKVDKDYRTSVPGIYAIGDVNNEMLLAHAASAQGIKVAEIICGLKSTVNTRLIPSCIYTSPEIASVGKTEKQLKAEGVDYVVGKFPFVANGKALAMNQADGFVKILAGKEFGQILGAHIIGPRATDMIGELTLAINMECTVEEITDTVHPHPTLSEAVQEACEAIAFKHSIHFM